MSFVVDISPYFLLSQFQLFMLIQAIFNYFFSIDLIDFLFVSFHFVLFTFCFSSCSLFSRSMFLFRYTDKFYLLCMTTANHKLISSYTHIIWLSRVSLALSLTHLVLHYGVCIGVHGFRNWMVFIHKKHSTNEKKNNTSNTSSCECSGVHVFDSWHVVV